MLTEQQNELCYSLKLAVIRGIVEIENENLWRIIERVLNEQEKKEES